MRIFDYQDPRFFTELARFIETRNVSVEITERVAAILAAVRAEGNAAVVRYTEQFDGQRFKANELRVTSEEMVRAARSLDPAMEDAFREAIEAVRSFHEKGLPQSWEGTNLHGARVGERWYPLRRVGIYIPAGSVPLVSSVIMTVTLARLAGVPEIAVFSPPGRDGMISSPMLAAMHLCGATEVYKVGGAQAIGAMAYGTATIPAVDKVFGPGNAYVIEAQRQVFGTVGVALLPGPSEALVIADETAEPAWLAADLLAQAEHGTRREKVYYVFSDEDQLAAVQQAIASQLKDLKHAEAIRAVLDRGAAFIRVGNLDEAIETANFIAPEHLELHVDPRHFSRLERAIFSAGAMLFGHHTPTVLGDFAAGPSHTLPTGRTGRFFSGLKIGDFFRRTSLVEYDRASLEKARGVVAAFAALEDLDAHGRSAEVRFDP